MVLIGSPHSISASDDLRLRVEADIIAFPPYLPAFLGYQSLLVSSIC